MNTEKLTITGRVLIEHWNSDGVLLNRIEQKNLIPTVGKAYVAQMIANDATTPMSHMAIGSSATAPTIADTTLNAELGRVALTSTTSSTNTVIYVANFGAGVGTGTLNEAGLFNAGAAGTMLAHTLFAAAIPKAAGDSVALTWTVTVS